MLFSPQLPQKTKHEVQRGSRISAVQLKLLKSRRKKSLIVQSGRKCYLSFPNDNAILLQLPRKRTVLQEEVLAVNLDNK